MSWIEKIQNVKVKIVTGDGQEFFPIWKGATRSRDMNATPFDFINIPGTLVRRGEASSLRINFEFFFQGLDNYDEATRFDEASRDKRPWTIVTPEYDELLVQPIIIDIDQKDKQNVSRISGQIFETIPDTFPDTTVDQKSEVLQSVEDAVEALKEAYIESGPPDAATQAAMAEAIEDVGETFKLGAVTAEGLAAVLQFIADALAALDNIVNDITTFADALAALARAPGQFLSKVQDRIAVLKEAFDNVKSALQGLQNLSFKKFFENIAGIFVAAGAECSVTSANDNADELGLDTDLVDYLTRNDVISQAEDLNNFFNDYIDTLGENTSEIDAQPTSFTPSADAINALRSAINKATGGLLQIAVGSRQERKYIVPTKPTNIIILCHRLLGKTDQATLTNFIELNEIKLDECILVPQGRELIYYV